MAQRTELLGHAAPIRTTRWRRVVRSSSKRGAFSVAVLACLVSIAGSGFAEDVFDPNPGIIHFGRVFDVAAWDFDEDGWMDLLLSDYVNGQGVLYGRMDRTFGEMQLLDVPASMRVSGHGVGLGDLNGNGHVDAFLVYNQFSERVLLNDSAGRLVDTGQQISAGSLWGTSVLLADVDSDGDLDAFVTYYQHGVDLYVNDGTGWFVASDESLGADFASVTPGDIDGDGDLDLIGRVDASTIGVVENLDGIYSLIEQLSAPGCRRIFLFDANDDSRTDLLVVGDEGSSVWIGSGGGGFARTDQTLAAASRAAIGDIDLDGDQDLALGSSIWLNNGVGDFRQVQLLETERLTALALIDLDGDDRPELILGSINLESGSGPLAIYPNVSD